MTVAAAVRIPPLVFASSTYHVRSHNTNDFEEFEPLYALYGPVVGTNMFQFLLGSNKSSDENDVHVSINNR